MKKINVNEMRVWSKKELREYWGDYLKNDIIDNDDNIELENGGVYSYWLGCRGEDYDWKRVDVVDGFFNVRDENDVKKYVRNKFENDKEFEDYCESNGEFIFSNFENWFGKNCVFVEGFEEEECKVYFRVGE